MQNKLFTIALLTLSLQALYSSNSKVVQLTQSNFNSMVLQSNEVWIVEFYAPWCGHCKSLAPHFDKAALALNGMVKVGAVNMDEHQSVGSPYGIQGFPTLKVFGADKKKPSDYQGERSAKAIVDHMVGEVRKIANARLGGSSSGSNNSGSRSSGSGSQSNDHSGGADVVELTGDNFHSKINEDGMGWLVIFYAPWCGHCKAALPEYSAAASVFKKEKNVKFGMINCDEHKSACGEYDVRGYPTIKWFSNGSPEDYQAGRDKNSFIAFVESKSAFLAPPKPLQQMFSQDVFNEFCVDNDDGLCVISFLPPLRDTGDSKRAEMIAELETVRSRYKGQPVSFLWSEGGAQFDLEETLGLGFGFPAFVAIHHGKKKYAVMRSFYSLANVEKFLSELMVGRAQVQNFYVLPKIKTKSAWAAEL